MTKIKIDEIITKWDGGGFYHLEGNIFNGGHRDENGKWVPFICKETVSRRINKVDKTKNIIYCECGREFIIDDNLIIYKCDY